MSTGPDGSQPVPTPVPAYPAAGYPAPQFPAPQFPAPAYQGQAPPAPGQATFPAPAYGAPGYSQPYGMPTGYPAPGYGYPPVLAPWGTRVAALLLDGIGPMLLAGVPAIFAMATAVRTIDATGASSSNPTTTGSLALLVGYVLSGIFTLWNRTFRQGRTGASLGKSIMKIRLVRSATGAPVGAGLAFGREFAHLLDSYSMYIGYLWPLWDAQKQTFADKVCSTVVVNA